MPPLQLTRLLETAFPNITGNGRALISVLGCINGRADSATHLATWLGFRDRYQLGRALRRQGVPHLDDLRGWARTLFWLLQAESTGASLRTLARHDQLDPAVAYRLIRRVTGRRWSQLRREGLVRIMARLQDGHATTARKAAADPQATPPSDERIVPNLSVSIRPTRTAYAPPPPPLDGLLNGRVSVSGVPFDVALAFDGSALVTRLHAASVGVMRLNEPRLVASIPVGPAPTRVIPSPLAPCAYVTTQFAEAVDVIDLQARAVVATIPVSGHALGAALTPDGHTLFVTTNTDRLFSISTAGRRVRTHTTIPWGCPQLVVHPDGAKVYVSCWRAGVVVEIATRTLQTIRTFALGGVVQDVVVSPDGRFLYVANESGWLDVVELVTGRAATRFKTGSTALGLALSPDGNDVLVGLLNAGRVLILERYRLTVRRIVETGGRPRLMAAHSTRPLALLANEEGWVDILR